MAFNEEYAKALTLINVLRASNAELLAALKALVAAHDAATTDEADRQHFLFRVESAAHAAIAKAEGRPLVGWGETREKSD